MDFAIFLFLWIAMIIASLMVLVPYYIKRCIAEIKNGWVTPITWLFTILYTGLFITVFSCYYFLSLHF